VHFYSQRRWQREPGPTALRPTEGLARQRRGRGRHAGLWGAEAPGVHRRCAAHVGLDEITCKGARAGPGVGSHAGEPARGVACCRGCSVCFVTKSNRVITAHTTTGRPSVAGHHKANVWPDEDRARAAALRHALRKARSVVPRGHTGPWTPGVTFSWSSPGGSGGSAWCCSSSRRTRWTGGACGCRCPC
jgi:hypothetical protein